MSERIHLKGLNGIRAIAAIAVVISHTNLALDSFGLISMQTWDLAGHGVTMFFALSGFLITFLLMHEKEKQKIDIKKFYLRRALRIWPLYFLYLIIYTFVSIYYNVIDSETASLLLYYVFFLANVPLILGMGLNFIGHFWSIGVEEQFYLFWPWLIKKAGSHVLAFVSIFFALFFIIRLLCRFFEIKYGYSIPYLIFQVNRFDCMAIGGMGAVLFFKRNEIFLTVIYSKVAQIIAWVVILLLAINKFHIASVIDPEIISVITVIIIINVSSNENRIVGLDNFIFNYLGKISYGIYVIHPLVILILHKNFNFLVGNEVLNYFLVYGGVLCLTIILSHISYEYFEKRFIQIKDKFSIIKSSSAMQNKFV